VETPPDSSFCFSAARTWSKCTGLDAGGVSGHVITVTAPPKNKKKKRAGIVVCYKQATPTGFEDLRAKQNLSKPVKIAGNAKGVSLLLFG
jgi:hypothetical protein